MYSEDIKDAIVIVIVIVSPPKRFGFETIICYR